MISESTNNTNNKNNTNGTNISSSDALLNATAISYDQINIDLADISVNCLVNIIIFDQYKLKYSI